MQKTSGLLFHGYFIYTEVLAIEDQVSNFFRTLEELKIAFFIYLSLGMKKGFYI
jgi:hypothetical protein